MNYYEIECKCGALIEVPEDRIMQRCKQCQIVIRLCRGEIQSFEIDHATRSYRKEKDEKC